MENKIKQVLEQVRPSLQADGGDAEFVSFDEASGIVKVKLTGACHHCPMSAITLKQGIEELLKREAPAVKEVQGVN